MGTKPARTTSDPTEGPRRETVTLRPIDDGLQHNVAIASAFRFHMFELAGQLARLGALDRLFTAMPRWKVTEAPSQFVASHAPRALLHYAWQRLHLPGTDSLHRRVVQDFDAWVARQLTDQRILVGLSSFATASLTRAKGLGMATVCDRGSTHVLEQRRVLDEEADRWGWPRIPFDPWSVDRELAEYALADRIFVPSGPARRSFVRQGTDPEKLVTLPYGVDCQQFSPGDPGSHDARRVISVGYLGLIKGHAYLLPAYRRVRRSGSTLVLVGSAPPDAVDRLAINDSDVEVLGSVTRARVADEMRRSGIFALTSVTEGLALVVAQAMASGLPVVATEATGAEELVTDGVEGFVVPTGDVDAFAAALDKLLADPVLAHDMGRAGAQRMQERGGWEQYGRDAHAALAAIPVG